MYSNLNIVIAKEDGTSKTLKYSIKNTALAQAWARALHEDYLTNDDVVMAKEFFLHAWGANNPRSKSWLCNELNYHIDRVNEYFNDNNIDYNVDMKFSAIAVNQSQLNDIHRHFELIQGHYKETTDIWNNANDAFRWSVNQFNHMCHELEGHLVLEEYGQSNTGTMIVCLYPNNKHPITEQQLSEFEMKNYKKGDVRLHYPQTGRQFIEAYLHSDENVSMDEIEPIKYISGEFDLIFHDINVDWDGFKTWLDDNNVDQSNPHNALGYATVAHGDIPDDIFDYNDITCVQLEREFPHIGITKVLAEKTFPYTGIKQYMYQRNNYYKTTEVNIAMPVYNKLKITLRNSADPSVQKDLFFNIKDHAVAQKWAGYLHTDYLEKNANIDKKFMLHGWVYDPTDITQRNLPLMVDEINFHIDAINRYAQAHNINYHIDMHFDVASTDQQKLNQIHHHFEILIGQIWNMSPLYDQFDSIHKWSINNLNWLCHEMEGQLHGQRAYKGGSCSSSIVWCVEMNHIVRHDMIPEDYELFQMKDMEFGDIRMHYAQTGKTHREAYHDNDADINDTNITGYRYLSGEFGIHFGIANPNTNGQQWWDGYEQWLTEKGIDVTDKTLGLGWQIFAQLDRSNWGNKTDVQIGRELWECDDLLSTALLDQDNNTIAETVYDYTWRDEYYYKKQLIMDSQAWTIYNNYK